MGNAAKVKAPSNNTGLCAGSTSLGAFGQGLLATSVATSSMAPNSSPAKWYPNGICNGRSRGSRFIVLKNTAAYEM
jgi:hypothetical protein